VNFFTIIRERKDRVARATRLMVGEALLSAPNRLALPLGFGHSGAVSVSPLRIPLEVA